LRNRLGRRRGREGEEAEAEQARTKRDPGGETERLTFDHGTDYHLEKRIAASRTLPAITGRGSRSGMLRRATRGMEPTGGATGSRVA